MPFTYNGLLIFTGITIKGNINNSTYKSFNEVPSDKLGVLMDECLRDLGKNGKAEGTIKDIGIRKVAWFVVSEEKRIIDNNVKSFYIMFMENGYTWSMFAANVPIGYCETLNREMEQLIESFITI